MGEVTWQTRGQVDWQAFAQGEYVGHARSAHVPEYRIRVDDQIAFVFRLTRDVMGSPYELQVGDLIRVESLTADSATGDVAQDNIRRDLVIQPDGTISLPLLNQVRAAGMTVDGLRQQLEERYTRYYKVPAITVTPLAVNTKLQDLIAAVDARQGTGGLKLEIKVNPDGKVYLPGLGAVCAQGMTVEELKLEVDARYAATIPGVDVTPVITQRAPRFVFVLGEVAQPGRFTLEGPTTLMGAIALAGGWNQGANLRQVVVFRRGEDWRLLATMLDVNGALYGRRPAPADEIWLNDSDIVVVPKSPILVANEFIDQFFTQGLYRAFPQFGVGQFNFDNFRSLQN
jgi:polysaccharide export outer membrane protein